jgi:hypothetical protein
MKKISKRNQDSLKEVAPGFSETRRRMLWMPASVAAAMMLECAGSGFAKGAIQEPSRSPKESPADALLEWVDFLKQCEPVARELHKDRSASGQEAYLHWLASMIMRVRTSQIPRAKVGRFGKSEPAISFGVAYRGQPFFAVEWQLEPGAFLPPHNHPNASACTIGLEGEARIRNFEIAGEAPEFSSRRSFLVRETHNEIISPGRINTLSAKRDNIHTFQAGKYGARGIDLSSYHGPDVGFSFMDIATTPKEPERRIFEAAWKGQSI